MIRRFIPFVLFTPFSLYSASEVTANIIGIRGLIDSITENIIASLSTAFLAGAVVVFFFGIVRYILAQQSGVEKDITNGKQFMMWGLIALFVAFSVYGIIKFAQGTLLSGYDGKTIDLPRLRITPGSVVGGLGGNSLPGVDSGQVGAGVTNNCNGKPVGTSCRSGLLNGTCKSDGTCGNFTSGNSGAGAGRGM